MGDLRDQLKKANLLSKKDARRLAHEDRVNRKQLGGAAGVEADRAAHDAELRRKKDAQREADRAAQAARQSRKDAAAELAACAELLRREVHKPGRGGGVRWYFVLRDGRMPYLELSVAERLQITGGAVCVVRLGPEDSHDYALMRADLAERVDRAMPGRVVHRGAPARLES